jgi:hypothetical protein
MDPRLALTVRTEIRCCEVNQMLEGKSIALIIFTALNALGVGFLLYVLVQFWKEEHKSKEARRRASQLSVHGAEPGVIVVTAPVPSRTPRQDTRLIRFPVRGETGQRRGDETVRHAIR